MKPWEIIFLMSQMGWKPRTTRKVVEYWSLDSMLTNRNLKVWSRFWITLWNLRRSFRFEVILYTIMRTDRLRETRLCWVPSCQTLLMPRHTQSSECSFPYRKYFVSNTFLCESGKQEKTYIKESSNVVINGIPWVYPPPLVFDLYQTRGG